MFNKLFITLIMFITITALGSCYDDTGGDCEEAPYSCDESAPSSGGLNFNVTIDADNPSVVIDLRTGDDFDSGDTVELITLNSTSGSREGMPNGEYSAMVRYTVNYDGKTYTVEAVDGVDLDYSSDDYCDGITCYEEGRETLELEFDRDAFIATLKGTGKECFIATAAYGSGDAWQVVYLRSFRDRVLSKSAAGRFFIREYYAHSPAAADFISGRPALKITVSGMLSAMIYAMMHPYLFAALFFVFIAIVILPVYVIKVHGRRKLTLPGAC